MIDPEIQKLLALQEKDMELLRVEKDLARLPLDRHRIKVEIETEEAAIEEARKHIMSLEVRRKEIDNEVGRLEDQVAKYKNQQLLVKKNEEYRALTHEIDGVGERISDLEEEEIRLMLEIDDENAVFQKKQADIAKRIEQLNREIALKNERHRELEQAVESLQAAVDSLRRDVAPAFLAAYDSAKRNLRDRGPFVSPIENGICKRSNLRVSNEMLMGAREHGTPHIDHDTGCVVYIA